MAGFLSVVYGSLFLFLLSVLKLWLLSRWLLPRLISFVVRRRVSRPSPSERPNRRVSNLPSRVTPRLDSAFTPSPRLPRVSNQSRQVRRSGERGVDITVGAVGFLHVRDVVVRFHDGPIERVVVGDLLYTGQLLTLLAWLFEFVGKRARGVRLRDAIDDETSRATTAARDEPFDGTGAQSSPVAPSAGAFIARSRSLARQSSSNPASSFDPPPGSTDNPGRPSRASAEGARDRFGTAGASGTIMNLNVPVLAAGLRVKLDLLAAISRRAETREGSATKTKTMPTTNGVHQRVEATRGRGQDALRPSRGAHGSFLKTPRRLLRSPSPTSPWTRPT